MPEMTYLEVSIDDEVFVFDITVRDSLTVQVMHGLDNLRKDVPCLVLRQSLVFALLDTFEQIMRRTPRELRWRVLGKIEEAVVQLDVCWEIR